MIFMVVRPFVVGLDRRGVVSQLVR
jgi:hypothetical protein